MKHIKPAVQTYIPQKPELTENVLNRFYQHWVKDGFFLTQAYAPQTYTKLFSWICGVLTKNKKICLVVGSGTQPHLASWAVPHIEILTPSPGSFSNRGNIKLSDTSPEQIGLIICLCQPATAFMQELTRLDIPVWVQPAVRNDLTTTLPVAILTEKCLLQLVYSALKAQDACKIFKIKLRRPIQIFKRKRVIKYGLFTVARRRAVKKYQMFKFRFRRTYYAILNVRARAGKVNKPVNQKKQKN